MPPRRITLVAHNIRSLWNVGSFFRSSDAFAVEKIWLTGYTGLPPRKEITKTAIGSEEWVPWEHAENPVAILRKLKDEGWRILALEVAPGAVELYSYVPSGKTCVLLGHELTGVPEELLDLADDLVKIPMLGRKESLNVSVAVGIALHHLRTAGGLGDAAISAGAKSR
jgi:23S rRNA (guanosine2251-2'-O)-methyltransferase